jgi:hypothetical protein
MTRKTRVVVLCEDRSHWHFIRAYFVERGWNKRQLTSKISPAGEGSAEQWVRETYALELNTYRSKAQENVCLVVMIDGDRMTLQQREQQLQVVAQRRGIQSRSADERVALFVPCRNIETWFAWLDGVVVDDNSDYKATYRKGIGRRNFAIKLSQRCMQDNGLDNAPISLQLACAEWARLDS